MNQRVIGFILIATCPVFALLAKTAAPYVPDEGFRPWYDFNIDGVLASLKIPFLVVLATASIVIGTLLVLTARFAAGRETDPPSVPRAAARAGFGLAGPMLMIATGIGIRAALPPYFRPSPSRFREALVEPMSSAFLEVSTLMLLSVPFLLSTGLFFGGIFLLAKEGYGRARAR